MSLEHGDKLAFHSISFHSGPAHQQTRNDIKGHYIVGGMLL